jgi:hypothetical protein
MNAFDGKLKACGATTSQRSKSVAKVGLDWRKAREVLKDLGAEESIRRRVRNWNRRLIDDLERYACCIITENALCICELVA